MIYSFVNYFLGTSTPPDESDPDVPSVIVVEDDDDDYETVVAPEPVKSDVDNSALIIKLKKQIEQSSEKARAILNARTACERNNIAINYNHKNKNKIKRNNKCNYQEHKSRNGAQGPNSRPHCKKGRHLS